MAEETAGHKGENSSPAKKKRSSKRFAFHDCAHHDAWNGIMKLTPEQVGVYWRIILLIYINRTVHSDADDVEMAQACHTPTKTFKRIKRELIARGRLEYDEENRVYFDKRAVEELTRLGFFSEEQTARALKRWAEKGRKPKPEKPVFSSESPEVLDVSSTVSQDQTDENQNVDSLTRHANHFPIPKEESYSEPVEPASGAAPNEPSAPSLPLAGGGRTGRRRNRNPIPIEASSSEREAAEAKHAAFVAEQRRKLAEVEGAESAAA